MGINGLLPLLKSIQKPISLQKFAGQTVGVDAYGWLHRGTVSCSMELVTGKPTSKFVDFAMGRVRMLEHFGVIPYIVFDGDNLPSKAGTEDERRKRREACKKIGLELLRAGKVSQAYLELQKAVDVTPEMARLFIEELKNAGVSYVVAPYEADAQMVYMERKGLVSAILSEDSDLLVFGAKCLLTKLDQYGGCIEINKADFCAVREVSLTGWSDQQFRQMAILSGCDYLASISGMGLKTAYRMLRKHKTVDNVIRMLHFDGKFLVPKGYLDAFRQAERTFLYQWVFCPIDNKLVYHTEPPQTLDVTKLEFIGAYVEPSIAIEVALGNVNPITKHPIILSSTAAAMMPNTPSSSRSNRQHAFPLTANLKKGPGVSIENFFKPKRIPLGELRVNDFVLSPHQLEIMRQNSSNGWEATAVTPLRQSENVDVAAHSPPIQLPRHYLEPHEIVPGPDTRAEATPPRPLSRGRSVSSAMAVPEPKRARLCEDGLSNSSSLHPPVERRSRFFAAPSHIAIVSTKLPGNRRSKNKEEFGIFSDDSIEEAFANMAEEYLNAQVSKKDRGQGLKVFRDGREKTEQHSRIDSQDSMIPSLTQSASGEAPPTPCDTPKTSFATAAMEQFSFTPTPANTKSETRTAFANGLPTPSTGASKIPLAARPATANVAKTDKGLQSALQRLGARALRSSNLATSPSTPPPTVTKPVFSKKTVPFPEVARVKHVGAIGAALKVPLPAVDEQERLALSKENIENEVRIGGSEDLIIHDSDEEEESYDGETGAPKLNFGRFAFAG